MIKTLDIKNFRGYQEVSLKGISNINIIVGANGSGKTALLEAIYLALGAHPELYFKIRKSRGLGESISLSTNLWSDMFFESNKDTNAIISYTGSSKHNRTLEVYYDKESSTIIPFDEQVSDVTLQNVIAFKWAGDGEERKVHGVITRLGVKLAGNPEPQMGSFFSSRSILDPTEASKGFSQLMINNREKEVIKAMKRIFPDILNLSVADPEGVSMVYAALRNVSRKIPLGLVSSGINKVLPLLIGSFVVSNGVLLVDEIENGLYYKTMGNIWKELIRFSRANNTQLFISSHSLECLKSLLPILKGNEKHFALIKPKFEKGRCTARVIEGKFFEASLERDVEFRD